MADLPRSPSLSQSLVPLTSFVGREHDVRVLTDLLRQPQIRLITLTGPGGIGKTRLALRVVEQLAEAPGQVTACVSLASVQQADLILPTIAQSLNLPDVAAGNLLEQITTHVTERPSLLVLDNLEQVLDAAALLITDLLVRCPGLTVLATSRVRLGISGEQIVSVAPLDAETARSLFVERARAVSPGWEISPANAPVIDAICSRLDRLPLAIELAAARTNVLPPPAMLSRLENRFEVLTGGPRDAPDRHKTMWDAIAWSYDLLANAEQRILRRLAVFVSGFTLDAAEAVADTDANVLNSISELVAASLVNAEAGLEDGPRFRLLESIREYAFEQLVANGEEHAVRRAHTHYFASLAEQAWDASPGPEFDGWLNRLRPETDNLRPALDWALMHEPDTAIQLAGALMDVWISFVRLSEGLGWIARALAAVPTAPTKFRTRGLMASGWLSLIQGNLQVAETRLIEALEDAETLKDEQTLIMTVTFLAHVALEMGDHDRARELFTEAMQRIVKADPPVATNMMAIAMMNIGHVTMAMGDMDAARGMLEQALALHMQGSGPMGIAFGHLSLGEILLEQGIWGDASTHFMLAFTTFAHAGHLFMAARAVEWLAGAIVTAQPRQAIRLLASASVILERGDWARTWSRESIQARTCETGRANLGEANFAAAWDEGTQWTWEKVRTEAITIGVDRRGAFPAEEAPMGLSVREIEVLQLVAAGHSNREIGDMLYLSERTVENHVRHVLDKLGVSSRVAAATWAVRHDLA